MSVEKQVEDILETALLEKGYGLVRIQLQGSKRKTLQIMIEHTDGREITVDDCADVSRMASVLLEVSDPIHESYILEVSSPGLDRPLTRLKDYERFTGEMIKLELKLPLEGSRRFRGRLLGVENEQIKLELEPEKKLLVFAFSDIQKARLIPDYEMSKSN